MSSEPLRLTRRNAPTLHNTLEAICEDVRVSHHGEVKDFVLLLNTERRIQIVTYGIREDEEVIERLQDAVLIVKGEK